MTVLFLPIIKTVFQSSASMVRFMVTQLSAKQKISCLGQGLKERKTKNTYVCTKNPGEQPDLYRQLGLSEPQQPGRTTAPCAAPEGTHQPAKCYLRAHEEPWKSASSLRTTGLTGLGSALRFLLLWPKTTCEGKGLLQLRSLRSHPVFRDLGFFSQQKRFACSARETTGRHVLW